MDCQSIFSNQHSTINNQNTNFDHEISLNRTRKKIQSIQNDCHSSNDQGSDYDSDEANKRKKQTEPKNKKVKK